MKKTSTFVKSILLATACVGIISCSKVADVAAKNCDNAADKVAKAGDDFFADINNKSKCQSYVDAIVEMMRDCPAYYPAGTKQVLLDFQKNGCK